MTERIAGILGQTDDEDYRALLVDEVSGSYRVPLPIWRPDSFIASLGLLEGSRRQVGVRKKIRIAVLDTGVMTEHPFIKRVLAKAEDFTQEREGIEDENGHGTLVSLIVILELLPTFDLEILSGKVLNAEGHGKEKSLIEGFRWAIQEKVEVINISAGIPRRKWLMVKCNGDCNLCRIAQEAVELGIAVYAAAGNEGEVVCPATAGLLNQGSGINAVSELDWRTGGKTEYSAPGNRSATTGPTYWLRTNATAEEMMDAARFAAEFLSDNEKFQGAIDLYGKVVELAVRIWGHRHVETAIAKNQLGLAYTRVGVYDKAIENYRDALDTFSEALGQASRPAVFLRINLGIALAESGERKAARRELSQASKLAKEAGLEDAILACKTAIAASRAKTKD